MEEYEYGAADADVVCFEKNTNWTTNTSSTSSIMNELKSYSFDDEILNTADRIHSIMKKRTRRGEIRVQLRYYLVYCAHLELGRDVDPISLGKEFGLTQSQVQKCDSLFSPIQTGYEPPKVQMSPINLLPGYCREVDINETGIQEVIALADNILIKDPTLFEQNPRTVAAGILKYYTFTKGIVIADSKVLKRITGRSNATIVSMYKRIAEIDNM